MFPQSGDRFPPEQWAPAFDVFATNRAWYSGTQQELAAIYAHGVAGASRGDADWTHVHTGDGTLRRGGLRGFLSRFFNGAVVGIAQGENRTRVHAPIAANLATLSADTLLAEFPRVRLTMTPDPNTPAGEPAPEAPARAAQALDDILNAAETQAVVLEAAEFVAGVGAVALTAHWEAGPGNLPTLAASVCDAVVPEWQGGRLVAANLFTTYPIVSNGVTVRTFVHVERHELGRVVHGLFPLTEAGTLAPPVPFDALASLEYLARIPGSLPGPLDNTIALPSGIDRLTVAWWRNRPTRQFARDGYLRNLGRADHEGAEQWLDAIDLVWSSWLRDVKTARARLVVPESFLEVGIPGSGGTFDEDREVFQSLAFTDLGDGQQIQAHQFAIRAKEHAETLHALVQEVTQFAGYSLSSYGDYGNRTAATATEVVDRTTMTERTRDRKARNLTAAIEQLAPALLELHRVHNAGPGYPAGARVEVEFADLSSVDPEKEARTFGFWRSAMAVSTLTLVQTLHPDWDATTIAAEVERIQRENGLAIDLDPARVGRVDPSDDEPDDDDLDTLTA